MQTDPQDVGAVAAIDRCGSCRGLFLEFFDGEPSAISRGLVDRGDVPHAGEAPLPAEQLTCPDCATAMVRRIYLERGPSLARCESCMAVFLTPSEVDALSRLVLSPEEREDPSWLERLLAWLGRDSD